MFIIWCEMGNDKSFSQKLYDLSKNKTTLEIEQALEDAFDERKDFCHAEIQATKTATAALKAILSADLKAQMKSQRGNDVFTSKIDWFSPHNYSKYQLVHVPPIQYEIKLQPPPPPPLNKKYIYCQYDEARSKLTYTVAHPGNPRETNQGSIERYGIGLRIDEAYLNQDIQTIVPHIVKQNHILDMSQPYLHVQQQANQTFGLTYNTPEGIVKNLNLQAKGCSLIKLDRPYAGLSFQGLNDLHLVQDAVILTQDDRLVFVDCQHKKLDVINETPQNTESYAALKAKVNAQPPRDVSEAQLEDRQLITHATLHGTKTRRSFEVDDIPAALAESKNNIYDKRLTPLFDAIAAAENQQYELTGYRAVIETSADQGNALDKQFIHMIAPFKADLSNSEFVKYHLAYHHSLKDFQNKKPDVRLAAHNTFQQKMKEKIYKDTYSDLEKEFNARKTKMPPETVQLLRTLMKPHSPSSSKSSNDAIDKKIHSLRTMRRLLETTWCQGTAITEYAEKEEIPIEQRRMQPYTTTQVVKRKALPFDERMPGYDSYKALFMESAAAVGQYNFNIEYQQAKAELKTAFYAPETEAQFKNLKMNANNCFIFYKGRLYHLNSERTLRVMPFRYDDVVPGAVLKIERPGFTASFERKRLTPYGKEYNYSDAQMRQLLGDEFPEDPNLKLADEMMRRAYGGATMKEWMQSARGMLPQDPSRLRETGTLPRLKPDSANKYLAAVKKQRATKQALVEDSLSAIPNAARTEAVKTARQIAQGRLSLSQTLVEPCALVKIPKMTEAVRDGLSTSSWVIAEDDANKVYFVDKSNQQTKVTTLVNPELHTNLSDALNRVQHPYGQARGEWDRLGAEHAADGFDALVFNNKDAQNVCHNVAQREGLVRRHKLILVFLDHANPGTFQLGFLDAAGHYQERSIRLETVQFSKSLDTHQNDTFISNENDIKLLNAQLKRHGVPNEVIYRQPAISRISPKLSTAITRSASEIGWVFGWSNIPGPKNSLFEPYLERYQSNQAINRLTFILEERRKLWGRYNEALQRIRTLIEAQPNTELLTEEPVYDASKPDKIYVVFDSDTKKFKRYTKNLAGDAFDEEELSRNVLWDDYAINILAVPDLKDVNQALAIDYYRVEKKDAVTLQKLRFWLLHQDEPLPFEFKPGVLYLCKERDNNHWCAAMSPDGEIRLTKLEGINDAKVAGADSAIIGNILPQTIEGGLTLKPTLVNPEFLRRCEEAARFIQNVGDGTFDQRVLPASLVPVEQRMKMIEMMRVCAEDPNSTEAQHYLRNYHKLYFYENDAEYNAGVGRENNSFVLIRQPQPTLYFIDGRGEKHALNLSSNQRETIATLAAKQQNRERSVDLTCAEVYHLITSHTSYSIEAIDPNNNARELGVLYIKDHAGGVYYEVLDQSGEVKEGFVPPGYLPTKGVLKPIPKTAAEILDKKNPNDIKTLLAYTAKLGHTGKEKIAMNTAQELIEKIKAEELDLKNALIKFVLGLLAIAVSLLGLLASLGFIPLAGFGIMGFITGGSLVAQAIFTGIAVCAGLGAMRAAVINTTWAQPGLSKLGRLLDELDAHTAALDTKSLVEPRDDRPEGLVAEVGPPQRRF